MTSGGANKGNGATAKWLRERISHDGEECLMWPFYIDAVRGYAPMGFEGRMTKAHIFMCKLVKGPRPTKEHEAAHSCGRGREGCVHPMHLSWKTRHENQQDRSAHGTAGWVARFKRTKLTSDQADEIRVSEESNTELALRFGVDRSTVRQIKLGKIWNHKAGNNYKDFTPEQIREIRSLIGSKSQRDIAKQFGVSDLVIHRIKYRKSYRHVPP